MLEFDRGLPQTIGGQPVAWEESETRTRSVRKQMDEYFAGKRRDFDLALDLRGTDFRKRCWNELLRIPYGETRSYARDRTRGRQSKWLSRRGAGEPLQSHRDHCSLPSRAGREVTTWADTEAVCRPRRFCCGWKVLHSVKSQESPETSKQLDTYRELVSISGVAASSVRV